VQLTHPINCGTLTKVLTTGSRMGLTATPAAAPVDATRPVAPALGSSTPLVLAPLITPPLPPPTPKAAREHRSCWRWCCCCRSSHSRGGT
jgi:hypothetical protein